MAKSVATILFDIDGTLLLTGGAGIVAMRRTAWQLFGAVEFPDLEYHGRTDFAIASDLFLALGLPFDRHMHDFRRLYHCHLSEALEHSRGAVLPGVQSLLQQLSRADDFSLGVLTGNARTAARLKLTSYGLQHFFDFGGYGDFHLTREAVARDARTSAAAQLGRHFDPGQLIVIGDTPADVRCARAIGAWAIAVATGGCSPDELQAAQPDLLLSSLAELQLATLRERAPGPRPNSK